MICEEVNNSANQIEQKTEIISPIQRVLKEQEEKDRIIRKQQYAPQLLSSHVIKVEIQPFESPHDRAFLSVRSATGCFKISVETAECFGLIEFLLEHNFAVISSGKVRRDKDPRENEDRLVTWFIFSKPNGGCA